MGRDAGIQKTRVRSSWNLGVPSPSTTTWRTWSSHRASARVLYPPHPTFSAQRLTVVLPSQLGIFCFARRSFVSLRRGLCCLACRSIRARSVPCTLYTFLSFILHDVRCTHAWSAWSTDTDGLLPVAYHRHHQPDSSSIRTCPRTRWNFPVQLAAVLIVYRCLSGCTCLLMMQWRSSQHVLRAGPTTWLVRRRMSTNDARTVTFDL
jgi:hypothetical protein